MAEGRSTGCALPGGTLSHDRCFSLVLESALARGQVHQLDRLERMFARPHLAVSVRVADRLRDACDLAVADLFSGVRLPRAKRAVVHLFEGQAPVHRQLRVPITGDLPRGLAGPGLAEAQEVLRALRPGRVPDLDDAMRSTLSGMRTLLRHVDAQRMRWVTWVTV